MATTLAQGMDQAVSVIGSIVKSIDLGIAIAREAHRSPTIPTIGYGFDGVTHMVAVTYLPLTDVYSISHYL